MAVMKIAVCCIPIILGILVYNLHVPVPEKLQLTAACSSTAQIIKSLGQIIMRVDFFNNYEFNTFVRRSSRYFCSQTSASEPVVELKKLFIGGILDDNSAAEIEYFKSDDSVKKGAIIYIHGGGFAYGSPAAYASVKYKFFQNADVTAVYSLRYSLAPEHVFPRAVDDCVEICKWIFDHSEELGIDRNRIQLVGDSAGGNLVINVALHLLREKEKYPILGLHPIYPAVQNVHRLPSSYEFEIDPTGIIFQADVARFLLWYVLGNLTCYDKFSTGAHISAKVADKFKEVVAYHNLGTIRSSRDINLDKLQVSDNVCSKMLEPFFLDWRFTLIFAPENLLSNLKHTNVFIYTCEVDVLADEGFMFVKLLQSLGVKVEHYHGEDCYHGSINNALSVGGVRLLDALVNNFRKSRPLSRKD